MALVKSTLAAAIANALASAHGQGVQTSDTTLGNAIADAVDAYIKAGIVTVAVTTPDTVNGTGSGSMT